jgi:hypothetical protein
MQADIYVATRPDTASPFGAAALVLTLQSPLYDIMPTLTADGLNLLFVRDDVNTPGDIFEATRPTTSSPFGAITMVANVSTSAHEDAPWIDATGLRLVFMRTNTFGELYETTRPARDQPFATPRMLTEIDVPTALDYSPTLSDDALEIFFASNRAGGVGGKDVWTARRATVDAPFSTPTLVAEVSSPMDEYGLRLSRDGRTLYLNYNTVTDGGQDAQMYTATRTCLSP